MIKLDGSHLEGGGSIARVALALSTLTGKAFELDNIRKNRPEPGLKSQHLFCVKALEKLCNAKTEGAELGSTCLKYVPGKIQGKAIEIDIQTAGSIPLFLQAVLLPSMFADKPVKLNVIGGTDGKWAAPMDYFIHVFLPQLRRFADIECKLLKRGYYPKGNGKVEIKIKPKFSIHSYTGFNEFLKDINEKIKKIGLIEQHYLMQIKGVSHASSDLQNANVAERQAKSAAFELKKYAVPLAIRTEYDQTLSTGSGITLWAVFSKRKDDIDVANPILLGADCLGERGKKAEEVGLEAAKNLMDEIESKAAVDRHLADQLLAYMALLPGSRIKVSNITDHTRTNIHVISQFLGVKFDIDEEEKIISVSEQ